MKTLSLGSYAANLESPSQVFTVCLAILTDVSPGAAAKHASKSIAGAVSAGECLSLVQRYQLNRAIASIMRDLNRFVAPYTYFGYRINDLTQLGVWIDLDALHEGERAGDLTQVLGNDWSGSRSAFVLDMSKAGLTLYRRRGKKIVWEAT